jgi:hypothetical protein
MAWWKSLCGTALVKFPWRKSLELPSYLMETLGGNPLVKTFLREITWWNRLGGTPLV